VYLAHFSQNHIIQNLQAEAFQDVLNANF